MSNCVVFLSLHINLRIIRTLTGAAVAYWLERRIRDRNEDFESEFDSPLTHTLSKVRDAQ